MIPGKRSVYAWRGAVAHGAEVVALFKTGAGRAEALRAALKARHPYETPVILELDVTAADPATAAWIAGETGDDPR